MSTRLTWGRSTVRIWVRTASMRQASARYQLTHSLPLVPPFGLPAAVFPELSQTSGGAGAAKKAFAAAHDEGEGFGAEDVVAESAAVELTRFRRQPAIDTSYNPRECDGAGSAVPCYHHPTVKTCAEHACQLC